MYISYELGLVNRTLNFAYNRFEGILRVENNFLCNIDFAICMSFDDCTNY